MNQFNIENNLDIYQEINNDIIETNLDRNHKFNYFYKILGIVGIFYTIPSIQFVFLQIYNKIDLEQCYFNHKCHQPFYTIYSFNNVISNLVYIILGTIFLIIVFISSKYSTTNPLSIYKNTGIIITLGCCMILEGIFSSIYHICPSETNFQFDTTFMIIYSCLIGIYLIQRRRKELIFNPFSCFIFFGILNILNVVDIKKLLINYQWIPITIFLVIISIKATNNIYFGRLSWYKSITNSYELIKQWYYNPKSPDNLSIFINLIVINLTNSICLIICNYLNYRLSTALLMITIFDNTIITFYYIFMKIYKKESIHKILVVLGILLLPIWYSALYFYNLPTTDYSLTQQESNQLNTPCILFNYFDSHDIWHLLSSIGMFITLLFIWFIDYDIKDYNQEDINIF